MNPPSRSAFATTESEDSAIAAAATIGLSSSPIAAERAPAATGIPMMLETKAKNKFWLAGALVSIAGRWP